MDILNAIAKHSIEAIVIGAGPSFRNLIGLDIPFVCRLYGCGIVSRHVKLDVYCYGDVNHLNNVPPPVPRCLLPKPLYLPLSLSFAYEPCLVYATDRCIDDIEGALLFDEKSMPSGKSSGGMALTLACSLYSVIGLIGFDGFWKVRSYYDPEGRLGQRILISSWLKQGKTIISLMDSSPFDDILQKA